MYDITRRFSTRRTPRPVTAKLPRRLRHDLALGGISDSPPCGANVESNRPKLKKDHIQGSEVPTSPKKKKILKQAQGQGKASTYDSSKIRRGRRTASTRCTERRVLLESASVRLETRRSRTQGRSHLEGETPVRSRFLVPPPLYEAFNVTDGLKKARQANILATAACSIEAGAPTRLCPRHPAGAGSSKRDHAARKVDYKIN